MSQTKILNPPKDEHIIDDDDDDEQLDPRVQDELEKLNKHTDEINRLEIQLEEANGVFRTLLSDSTQQLKALSTKVGTVHIEKARPYFEALEVAQKAQKECQAAATSFQRANGIHAAAKETIALAETRFLTNSSEWQFDNAWQEMLNHATMKVMEAEKKKAESEADHSQRAAFYTAAEQACQRLEKRLKKSVSKAALYFEQKDAFNRALEGQKDAVHCLQADVGRAKADYADSLHRLESISESIHAQRKLKRKLSIRRPGVGSDYPTIPADYNIDVADRLSLSGRSSSKNLSDGDDSFDCPAQSDAPLRPVLSCPDMRNATFGVSRD